MKIHPEFSVKEQFKIGKIVMLFCLHSYIARHLGVFVYFQRVITERLNQVRKQPVLLCSLMSVKCIIVGQLSLSKILEKQCLGLEFHDIVNLRPGDADIREIQRSSTSNLAQDTYRQVNSSMPSYNS